MSEWHGVIDIGTNSVLLLLARRRPDGTLEVVRDQSTITRLGQGAGQSGMLAPEAIARTLACLKGYREVAEAAGATLTAVTTEGVRMARNQAAFLEPAREVLGQPVRLLSGDEEAELSYLSVARETPEGGPLRVLDIGGGSTELVVGDGLQLLSARSYPVGSVRLTERLLRTDPPSPEMLAAAHGEALTAFRGGPAVAPHRVLHGLAGTVTTVAALLLELPVYDRARVDGARFTREQVLALRDALAAETLDQRCTRPCLERGRADVIVAGVTILLAALEHCGAEILVVRDRGLRYALV